MLSWFKFKRDKQHFKFQISFNLYVNSDCCTFVEVIESHNDVEIPWIQRLLHNLVSLSHLLLVIAML